MCAPMLALYVDALVNRYFILSFSVPFWSTFSLKKPFFFPLQLSWFGTLFILTVFLTILRAKVHASPRSLLNYFFFSPLKWNWELQIYAWVWLQLIPWTMLFLSANALCIYFSFCASKCSHYAFAGQVVPQISCPIALFTYYNPILKRGVDNFMSTVRDIGIRGNLYVMFFISF